MSVILAIAAIIFALWLSFIFLRLRRRRTLRRRPLPRSWMEILERNVPLYRRLPASLREELHGHINVFLHEKRFEGCGGLEINDEIKVTIAGQACILLLNRETDYYPRLFTILVYPSSYVAQRIERNGYLRFVSDEVRLGESHTRDYVVLSWDDVKHSAAGLEDGHNVVLHEFSHQLDQEDGVSDGAPILERKSRYLTWARVLSHEYEQFCQNVYKGQETLLDEYGATNPAEFFAVLTEAFFEKPKELKQKHPRLYSEVKKFYKVDPVEWVGRGEE